MEYSSFIKSQIIKESRHLLKCEAAIHQTLEECKSELGLDNEYDFKVAYLEIIEVNGIENFLKSTSRDVSPKMVNAVLRRIDSTGDGNISFADFLKFLTPKSDKKITKTRNHTSSYKIDVVDKENAEYSPISEYIPTESTIKSNLDR
jgi:hypothetical protein